MEYLWLSHINWHVLKWSASLPLAFKRVRCCQDLLYDQKVEEPGRCRMRVQLKIACRDCGRADTRRPSNPPLAMFTTAIQSMSRIFSKWIAEDLWRTHTQPPMNVQYLIFSPFFLPFPCLGWGCSVKNLMEMEGRNRTTNPRAEYQ